MWSRPSRGLVWTVVVGALLASMPATGSLAAEEGGAPPGTLCETIDLDRIDASNAVQLGEMTISTEMFCVYEVLGDDSGTVAFTYVESFALDDVRTQFPDAVDVTVGGMTGFSDGKTVFVGLANGVLAVEVDISEQDAAGVDLLGYAIGLAEMAAADVEAAAAATAAAEAAIASAALAPPPEVAGVRWGRSREESGADMAADPSSGDAETWAPLLDAAGADFDQLSMLSATAFDAESDEVIGNYSAIRIAGADESILLPAILDWFRQALGTDDIDVEERDIGGKDVTVVTFSPEQGGAVYVVGDTIYGVNGPDELLAGVFEQLP